MPLGAIVAGLPVCMGNTGRSTLRRTRQQAHHGGHARLHAEFFENVLEMLLHRDQARQPAVRQVMPAPTAQPCGDVRGSAWKRFKPI